MEFIGIFAFIVVAILLSAVKIIQEFERGVIYTFGKYTHTINPGIQFVIPVIQKMVIIDVRTRTQEVPPQELISRDNVSVRVTAVIYYRVVDSALAVNKVENFIIATNELAQTTLRSVLGKHELDDILSQREQLNADIQEILDQQAEGWGIKVVNVALKNVDLDPSMVRAIAKQAEAERERRAKIINAEGELQAAKQLDQAAEILASRPETMQLRYLGTMGEFALQGKSNTVVLPLPLDMLKNIIKPSA